jgi:hypothetical protein
MSATVNVLHAPRKSHRKKKNIRAHFELNVRLSEYQLEPSFSEALKPGFREYQSTSQRQGISEFQGISEYELEASFRVPASV